MTIAQYIKQVFPNVHTDPTEAVLYVDGDDTGEVIGSVVKSETGKEKIEKFGPIYFSWTDFQNRGLPTINVVIYGEDETYLLELPAVETH